jgi:hypothetical protein
MITGTKALSPIYEERLKILVEEHRTIEDEPLLLAVYYVPERNPEDIFLFEAIEKFGGGEIEDDREMFEVTYGSTPGFPMATGQQLHLVMTSPEELQEAVKQAWSHVKELRTAFSENRATVLFKDEQKGKQLLSLLHA